MLFSGEKKLEIDIYTLGFIAYLVGTLFRTLYGYLWKMLENPDLSFDKKYWVTMIISMILSIIIAFTTFMGVLEQLPDTDVNRTFVFFTFVSLGYALNDMVNRPVSYTATKAVSVTPEP